MVNQNQNTIMEREQFFILEKDFLAGRQVGDLIQSCGIEGLGAYMVILLYLRHQPRYRGCYTLSLLQQLARCNNGTVEMFGNVILNFGLFSLDEGEEPEFYSPYLDRVMEPLERKRANSRRNGLKGGRPAKKVRPVRTADETCVRHGAETAVQERLQLAVAEEEKPRKTYNTIQNNTEQYKTETTEKSEDGAAAPVTAAAAAIATDEEDGQLPLRPYTGWEAMVDEMQADRFWMEMVGMHSGLGELFVGRQQELVDLFKEHVRLYAKEAEMVNLKETKRYFANCLAQGTRTCEMFRQKLYARQAVVRQADAYRFETLVEGRRTYQGYDIPPEAPPRPGATAVWDERAGRWGR